MEDILFCIELYDLITKQAAEASDKIDEEQKRMNRITIGLIKHMFLYKVKILYEMKTLKAKVFIIKKIMIEHTNNL